MCGGAIISDFIDEKRRRKLTREDLWSELDTISDLLSLDSASAGKGSDWSEDSVSANPKQVNKGEIFCLGFEFLRFHRKVEDFLF